MNSLLHAFPFFQFSQRVKPRITGVIGVLMLISGSFAQYVKSLLVVPSDIYLTSEKVIASETLFRFGIFSGLMMCVFFIFYVDRLRRILGSVDPSSARLMLILAIVPMPMFMLNQLNLYAIGYWADQSNLQQISFFLDIYRQGNLFVSIFFGLWLLPLGYLVFRSNSFPKFIGILLMVGCFGYVILFLQAFLLQQTETSLWNNPFLIVTHIAELALMICLLIKGEKILK